MSVFRVERAERRKPVPGYGGRYEVSDLGRVYSGGCELSVIGGKYVNLSGDGVRERVKVGYLVARAFLPNPEVRPYVVHRDGDVRNNRVENLEWSEKKERGRVGRPIGSAAASKAVMCYKVDGEWVGRFESIKEAAEKLDVARYLIRNCAEGRARRAKQYVFRYV